MRAHTQKQNKNKKNEAQNERQLGRHTTSYSTGTRAMGEVHGMTDLEVCHFGSGTQLLRAANLHLIQGAQKEVIAGRATIADLGEGGVATCGPLRQRRSWSTRHVLHHWRACACCACACTCASACASASASARASWNHREKIFNAVPPRYHAPDAERAVSASCHFLWATVLVQGCVELKCGR